MAATRTSIVQWIAVGALAALLGAHVWRTEARLHDRDRLLASHKALATEHADLAETVNGLARTVRGLADDVERLRSTPHSSGPSSSTRDNRVDEILARLDRLEREVTDLRDSMASRPAERPSDAVSSSFTLASRSAILKAAGWSAEQATGAPDTLEDGDRATAWASLDPDGGTEWLEVEFERAIVPRSIVIRETYNPGAVVRVEAEDDKGASRTVWADTDTTKVSPGELVIDLGSDAFRTRKVVVYLDTRLVEGWNEIDAVGLRAGRRTYWATAARASSHYSTTAIPPRDE